MRCWDLINGENKQYRRAGHFAVDKTKTGGAVSHLPKKSFFYFPFLLQNGGRSALFGDGIKNCGKASVRKLDGGRIAKIVSHVVFIKIVIAIPGLAVVKADHRLYSVGILLAISVGADKSSVFCAQKMRRRAAQDIKHGVGSRPGLSEIV